MPGGCDVCSSIRTADPLPSARFGPGSTGRFLLAWLPTRRSLRPSTRLAYQVHLRRYLLPHLGTIPLTRLSAADIERMHQTLFGSGATGARLSTATVHRVHATLTSALNHAVRRGLIATNPAALIDLPPALRREMTVWERAELNTFLLAAQQHRLWALFTLMAYTGVRRGEAVGLRWRDVDLNRGFAHIEQQIIWLPAAPVTGPPKTRAGRRIVALAAQVVHALQWQAARQALERSAASGTWVDAGLVFTQPCGAALDPARVSRAFDRLVSVLDVPRIRLHDVRHTSASLGLAAGESLLEVSRRLGHSSITITAEVYAHVSPSSAHAAAERLAEHLATQLPQPAAGANSVDEHADS
jgi:integrase